jgi:hypothetical protein
MWFDCLQMASMPSRRTNKLCTHAHYCDRSAAATVVANGTYFVDTPCISSLFVTLFSPVMVYRLLLMLFLIWKICTFKDWFGM